MAAEVRHTAVLDVLGAEIAGGAVPPGTVVTLERLQARFGVSRTVAREAMRLLEQLGMVSSGRRVGIVVRPAADWSVLDPLVIRWRLAGPGRDAQLRTLTELRAAVEPVAAAAAARHADGGARERLLGLAARLRALGEAGALEDFLVADVAFHTLLLEASGNELFAALRGAVAEVLAGRTHLGLMPPHPEPEALDAHDAVARAVADGDAAGAERWAGRLMAEVRAAVVDRSAPGAGADARATTRPEPPSTGGPGR